MRRTDRTWPQRPRRRRGGQRQLRHRQGRRLLRPGTDRHRGVRGDNREARLRGGRRRPGRRCRRAGNGTAHPPAHRLRRAHGADRRHLDAAGARVLRVGVGGRSADHPGRVVGRLAVPPGGGPQPRPRLDHHGHARVDGDGGRMDLVRRCADRRHRPRLLRDRSGHRHADPPRQVVRGQGQAPLRRRHPRPRRARPQDRPTRGRLHNPGRRTSGRYALRRATGREGPRRRRGGRRRIERRCLDDHRRARSGPGRSRRRCGRGDHQRQRIADRRGHPGRRRHDAGPDHAPRR